MHAPVAEVLWSTPASSEILHMTYTNILHDLTEKYFVLGVLLLFSLLFKKQWLWRSLFQRLCTEIYEFANSYDICIV